MMMQWRKNRMKTFGDVALIKKLISDRPIYKYQVKFILQALALIFIIIGLANLQMGSKIEKVQRKGVDVVVALDVSKSMLAEDIKPNRLSRAKQYVSNLIDRLQNDRIALVIFAGNAYLQMPLTVDYASAKMYTKTITTDLVPTQGTDIEAAIQLAMESFKSSEDEKKSGSQKNKVIVIITDGENHESGALEKAKSVSKEGVIIHTLGIGSKEGAPIPVYRNNVQANYKRDNENNIVLSKINEVMLQQIASASSGKYFHLSGNNDVLESLVTEIESMEKKDFEERVFTDYQDQFQYFLALGLLFLVLDFLVSERRSKWLDRLNIFSEKK